MKRILAAALAASSLAAAVPALAQPYGGPPPGPRPGAIPGQQLHMQMDALEQRARDGIQSGQIDRAEAERVFRELGRIRAEDADIRARNGGRVSDIDRGRLQDQLDRLSQTIRWMRQNGEPRRPGAPGERDFRGPRDFWNGAPASIHEREDWMEQRLRRGLMDGSITRDEARRAFTSLRSIRDQEASLLRRHRGVLTQSDREVLQDRLDQLGRTIGWMRRNDERRY